MSGGETNYNRWVAKAENDRVAIQSIVAAQRVPWDVVCFHAQQAAEKLLKGFVVFHRREPMHIHDLVALLAESAEIDPDLAHLERDCRGLTRHAVDSRYPDYPHDPDEEEGNRAIEAMERVRSAVLQRLPGENRGLT